MTGGFLVSLLLIQGDNVALVLLANLIVYAFGAAILSFLLTLVDKVKYPWGAYLSILPQVFLAVYVYSALNHYITSNVVPSMANVSGLMLAVLSIVPVLVAVVVLIVYSAFIQRRTGVFGGSESSS